jgi:ABC-type phosphate/phosphonate transport system substrate-binding protein
MADVLQGVNSKDALVAIKLNWMNHLNNVFSEFEAQFEILPNVATAVQRIRNKRLHGLSMDIARYHLLKEEVNLKPVFLSSNVIQPIESYLLLVYRDTDWQRLSSQSFRRLVTETKGSAYIGHMWLETVLHERKLPVSNTYFAEIIEASKPARVILPVFFRQADACLALESAYRTMVELNPQISKQLTVLAKSPGIIRTIHCATDMLSQEYIDRFKRGVRLESTVNGRQLLLIFRSKKTFLFKPEYLIPSETIFQNYRQIMDQSKS